MIVSLVGKGGVGKTLLCALLLDELARQGYADPVLAVDADPAMTLHLALGLPIPPATIAAVRETTPLDAQSVRQLPAGMSPTSHVRQQLHAAQVLQHHHLRSMALDYLAMGQGEGPGCYCRINQALTVILGQLIQPYRLMLVDNEAGLEHLSRYRLPRADLLLVVTTPAPAAQAVAWRLLETARALKMDIGESWLLFNNHRTGLTPPRREGHTLFIPTCPALADLERAEQPAIALPEFDPLRAALHPLVERLQCV
jgi:CO dehydrogenase maturation factor